jgi:aminoglycoside 6'-N-acetyltransferase
MAVRPLARADAELLSKWLSNPTVLQYYEGRNNPFDLERVKKKFYKQNDYVSRNIVLLENKPIGYIQYYPLTNDGKKEFGYSEDEIIYGLDQFIGETEYWGKGYGTKLIKMLTQYLTTTRKATKIVMDPQQWNERAIRCYEKCGFVKKKELLNHEYHEGEYRDCWLIEYVATR